MALATGPHYERQLRSLQRHVREWRAARAERLLGASRSAVKEMQTEETINPVATLNSGKPNDPKRWLSFRCRLTPPLRGVFAAGALKWWRAVAIVTSHQLIRMASLTSSTASGRWNCSLASTFQFSNPAGGDRAAASPLLDRLLQGCGLLGCGLGASFLLHLAAAAVPIQAARPANPSAAALGSAAGPRRPGLIPLSSQSLISSSGSAIPSGPRRPLPARANGLTVARYAPVK